MARPAPVSVAPSARRLPVRGAWFALAGSALMTLLSVALQADYNDRFAQRSFGDVVQETQARVRSRLATYEYLVRGARGAVISAGVDEIDRLRFLASSDTGDIDSGFPGALGVGFIRRVRQADEERFVAAVRDHGWPAFGVKAFAQHAGDRYVIQYVEPLALNAEAVGLDIASEETRRTAAEAAMDTGLATLTAPITLAQATGNPLRGFQLLLPIYPPFQILETPEARRNALVGWSFAPLLADEVLADFDLDRDFSLSLSDIGDPGSDVFFTSPGHQQSVGQRLSRVISIPIYGRVWRADFKATPDFVASLHLPDVRLVGASAMGVSLLLAGLVLSFVRSRQGAAQLRAEQARRAAIVASTSDAVIGESLEGLIIDWNRGAELLFGYTRAEVLGRPAASVLLPPDRAREDEEIRAAMARGEVLSSFETTRVCADARLVDVSVVAVPIRGEQARILGFAKTIRDISVSKRIARENAELRAGLERLVSDRTAQLDASQRDLRNILDAVPSLVSYWDRDLRNRFANRAFKEWLGWDPQAMPGKPLHELMGDAFQGARARCEAALRGEPVVLDTVIPTLQGQARNAVIHYLPDRVGDDVQGFYVFVYDVTAQTEARSALAAALRDNEALLGTLHEHAIVSVTDSAGRIVEVNSRFCAISGYTREELLGQNHRLINSGVHGRQFWTDVWRTIASGRPWRGEVCNRRKDGSLYWVESMLAPFRGADGRIEKYISIRVDITQAKQNEQKLQQARDRFALAADAAAIGIWDWDLVGDDLGWDEWMYSLYEEKPAVENKPSALWAKRLHPDDRERVAREVREALSGERPFDTEFRIVRSTGEVRYLKASARVIWDLQRKPVRMTGTNFDITARKCAELELVETSSLLRSVLESASEVAIIAGDPQLRITVFNRGAERLLGYNAADIVGRATPELFHDRAEVLAMAADLSARTGETVTGGAVLIHPSVLGQERDWTYVCKDGRRITVSLVVTAMRRTVGDIFGYLGVAHNVTQRREQERSQSQAMRQAEAASLAKSEFLANMSHELRTPLNAVVGLSHLLAQTRISSEQATLVEKIQVAANMLLTLINEILDVSKIEAGALALESAPFSLSEVLTEVTELAAVQAEAKNLRFAQDVTPGIPDRVEGDALRLMQILNNLLINAIKFTPEGEVTLRVRLQNRSEEVANLSFEIQDTGIGISEEVQTRLFQPFAQADASTTRRFGGTGLGLSIARNLAHLMGGDVSLSSRVGVGSLFRVNLPLRLTLKGATARRLAALRPGVGLGGVRVLVVDDSDINVFVAQHILEQAGARVSVARKGAQAIEFLREHPASCDLVLMDMHMPEHDGYQTTKQIRVELGLRELPIIALTADARPSERLLALESGMNDFLAKPFAPADLVRSIRLHVKSEALARDGSPAPTSAIALSGSEHWPELAGIDGADARRRLGGDCALFCKLLTRVLAEFAEVTPPADLSDRAACRAYAERMHKLRGSAGGLGAEQIRDLAARLEAAFSRGDPAQELESARALAAQLEALRASLALHAIAEPDTAAASSAPLTAEQVGRVLGLLHDQSLAALEQAPTLYAWARSAWAEADFEQFSAHIQNMRFSDAAALLEAHSALVPQSVEATRN
jgi:PAS domain S-box-containing protein